ncbi:MAG: hypothetical protein H6741_08650 [Alphaproteobacteria bacterium]|nr:hypothetical protein [Alphaproteobacteria bacterium]
MLIAALLALSCVKQPASGPEPSAPVNVNAVCRSPPRRNVLPAQGLAYAELPTKWITPRPFLGLTADRAWRWTLAVEDPVRQDSGRFVELVIEPAPAAPLPEVHVPEDLEDLDTLLLAMRPKADPAAEGGFVLRPQLGLLVMADVPGPRLVAALQLAAARGFEDLALVLQPLHPEDEATLVDPELGARLLAGQPFAWPDCPEAQRLAQVTLDASPETALRLLCGTRLALELQRALNRCPQASDILTRLQVSLNEVEPLGAISLRVSQEGRVVAVEAEQPWSQVAPGWVGLEGETVWPVVMW